MRCGTAAGLATMSRNSTSSAVPTISSAAPSSIQANSRRTARRVAVSNSANTLPRVARMEWSAMGGIDQLPGITPKEQSSRAGLAPRAGLVGQAGRGAGQQQLDQPADLAPDRRADLVAVLHVDLGAIVGESAGHSAAFVDQPSAACH